MSPNVPSAEASLISILQRAYSGELAAALAYRGHWRSLKHDREIAEIRQIELEEWHHRRRLGEMLADLGAKPRHGLDAFQGLVGLVILLGCSMVGWFVHMYFAGRLESQNDREYEEAALHAEALGLQALRDELRAFAQLERDHETYFMRKVDGHPALPFWQRIFKWGPPRP